MHTNVRASHDRARLHHVKQSEHEMACQMDDVFVSLGGVGGGFCIISLRDAHGLALAFSETHLDTLRGYNHFVEATVLGTLGVGEEV